MQIAEQDKRHYVYVFTYKGDHTAEYRLHSGYSWVTMLDDYTNKAKLLNSFLCDDDDMNTVKSSLIENNSQDIEDGWWQDLAVHVKFCDSGRSAADMFHNCNTSDDWQKFIEAYDTVKLEFTVHYGFTVCGDDTELQPMGV